MAGALPAAAGGPSKSDRAITEPKWVKLILMGACFTFLALFLVLPVILVFVEAFKDGPGAYLAAILEKLSLIHI